MMMTIMDDINAKRLLNDLTLEREALRRENAELHHQNSVLNKECSSLREELASTRDELALAQANLDTLTDASQVLRDHRDQLQEQRDQLQQNAAELQAAVDRLTNLLWGRRSEKRDESNQPTLFDVQPTEEQLAEQKEAILAAEEDLDEAAERQLLKELLERRRRRRLKRLEKRGREEFPAHLERRERVLDLDEDAKQGLVLFKVDTFERMCFERPRIYIEVIKRYQYVRPKEPEAGVIAPEPPLGILPGVKYDFSIIAAVLAMKFSFHQPTYRQEDILAQAGYSLGRSTLNDLYNYCVEVLDVLYWEAWRWLMLQPILLGDDTPVRLLTRSALEVEDQEKVLARRGSPTRAGPPGSVTSYAWLYTGLNGMAPYNLFHWSLTHEDCWIDSHLASFEGIFVGDATGPNARLEQRSEGRIIHAACNAHARREFLKAEKTHPLEAARALAFYRRLYAIETRGRLLGESERLALRQREAVPIWKAFGNWINSDAMDSILPKSPLGKALTYVRNHWVALQRYVSDARLPIDNNQSERYIRALVIGRNNWTFLGHPQAAPGRLRLFSIASSAHRHHLIMQDYFEDILRKLAYAQQREPGLLEPGSDYLQSLLPDRWAAAHPASVHHDRRRELEQVNDNRSIRRLSRSLDERRRRRAEAAAELN
jgi:transposase